MKVKGKVFIGCLEDRLVRGAGQPSLWTTTAQSLGEER